MGACGSGRGLDDAATVFAVTARVRRVFRRQAAGVPVGFFLLGGGLLSFGRGDLAFDVEGDTVGARHTEASGITAYLEDASEGSSRVGRALVRADLSRVACLL
jgi:hypothetical protein